MTMASPTVVLKPGGYCVDPACRCHTAISDPARERCCDRCWRAGDVPGTVVLPPDSLSFGEAEARIRKTHREHAPLLQDFHRVWYESNHTWVMTHFLGIGLMKNPCDLWIYQDIITNEQPHTIIETGTYTGGSALWFAYLLDMLGIEGRVITIDRDDYRKCDHPRITFIGGDSRDPGLAAAVLAEVEHPLLISLDADHTAEHVRAELELYAPAVGLGEYLVVEDTNISWPSNRGARGGLEDYLAAHPGEWQQDVIAERYLITCNPGGWLRRVGPYVAV